ncbi:WhiB family transcriptional regulator [Mycobacterium haemophilum]|nr:WhiB family transcriptional regulator [Mycobacterium haemophilum]
MTATSKPEPLALNTWERWQDQALCAQSNPEVFFPAKGGAVREAKEICLLCKVRIACLEYALQHDERFGVWGGLSEHERRSLRIV